MDIPVIQSEPRHLIYYIEIKSALLDVDWTSEPWLTDNVFRLKSTKLHNTPDLKWTLNESHRCSQFIFFKAGLQVMISQMTVLEHELYVHFDTQFTAKL